MVSISLIAIGSSMIASSRRASLARDRSVSSAVSETPRNVVASALVMAMTSSQHLVECPQVAGGGRRLVPLLAHGLPYRAVQRLRPWHLPVDHPVAPRDPLAGAGVAGEVGQLVEDRRVPDQRDIGVVVGHF